MKKMCERQEEMIKGKNRQLNRCEMEKNEFLLKVFRFETDCLKRFQFSNENFHQIFGFFFFLNSSVYREIFRVKTSVE